MLLKPLSKYQKERMLVRIEARKIDRLIETDINEGFRNIEFIYRKGVPETVLEGLKNQYHPNAVGENEVFNYIYGFLNSADHKREILVGINRRVPEIPFPKNFDDFRSISNAGKELLLLHRHYNSIPISDIVKIKYSGYKRLELDIEKNNDDFCYAAEGEQVNPLDFFKVDKMSFGTIECVDKDGNTIQVEDKSVIVFNSQIRIENIPMVAYDYVVNGKSAIEWIVERYKITSNAKGEKIDITRELASLHKNPRYVLDLLLRIITLSCQTMDLVKSLPSIDDNVSYRFEKTVDNPVSRFENKVDEKTIINEIHIHGNADFSSAGDIKIGNIINKTNRESV